MNMDSKSVICFFFAIATALGVSSCQDVDEKCGDLNNSNYRYELIAPVSISPADTIYHVGDTIGLAVDLPKSIVDRRNDEIEVIVSQNVLHSSWLVDLNNSDNVIDALDAIEYLFEGVTVGEFGFVGNVESSFLSGIFGEPQSADNIASIYYRFVLKKRGTYWFTFGGQSTGVEDGDPFLQLSDPCPNGSIQLHYVVNNGANNNFDLLCKTNSDFCSRAFDESNRLRAFDNRAGYVFKVVE